MPSSKKSLLAILALILATTAALFALGANGSVSSPFPPLVSANEDPLSVTAEVVQEKILQGGEGKVAVALNLEAARLPEDVKRPVKAADLVIVLDRSGSMEGRKIKDARQAIIGLLDHLGPEDRLALLTYSNRVQNRSPLVPMNAANRLQLAATIEGIIAGGGTNLGAGLDQGMKVLLHAPGEGRQRKVILISDGLANQGVTGIEALGRMASTAVENRFSISTVGVGLDFNEIVMTAIADHGAGSYHFLEDPKVFARVFESELQTSRQVAAADVNIRFPLAPGMRLVSAGGYPISHKKGAAVIHPGNLLSGQRKTLHLTFQVPTDTEKTISLGKIEARYRHQDRIYQAALSRPLTVACVKDPAAVVASINKDRWADQVVMEEFGRLKEEVAADIRAGEKERARQRIQAYEQRQSEINAVVGSGKVAQNLETDVNALRLQVDETFFGAPAAVAQKKKQVSKALQYESYKKRRNK
jgi:Ca-activated chloride channel family protein